MNQREVEEMEARLSALYAEIQSLTDDNAELRQENEALRLHNQQLMSDRSVEAPPPSA